MVCGVCWWWCVVLEWLRVPPQTTASATMVTAPKTCRKLLIATRGREDNWEQGGKKTDRHHFAGAPLGDHRKLLPGRFWTPIFLTPNFFGSGPKKFGIYSLRSPRNCLRYLRRSTFIGFHRSPTFAGGWESDGLWCTVMDCDAVWCTVMDRDAVWCGVMKCNAMWCSVMQCDALWWIVMDCDGLWWTVVDCDESAW